VNSEQPMIQSGCENLYTHFTQFVKQAKKNGEVVHCDEQFLIVKYDDNTTDIFDVAYRKIYVGNMDILKVYVKVGDKFRAGDILAESKFCEDGKIMFGKNLLTAIMVYYGHNYEDGIVISDRLVKDDSFTSLHFKDLSFNLAPNKILMSLCDDKYKPLPEPFDFVDVGTPYAKLKEVPISTVDYCTIFNEEIPFIAKKRIMITEVNIYPNTWNTDIPEFKEWVEEKIQAQNEKEISLKKVITTHLSKDEANQFIRERNIDKFSHTGEKGSGGKYRIKGEKVNGIHVELFGIYRRPIELGDKIANRHGNKGVIAEIIPHEKMPQLEDGRNVDICINPLGIISRMNIGQLFELHLAMSLYDLRKHLKQMISDEKSKDELRSYLIDYIKILDQTEGNWYLNQFTSEIDLLPNGINEQLVDDLYLIQPPFESITMDVIKEALVYTNTPFEFRLYDPVVLKDFLLNTVAVGYIYFFRMVHIAEERLAARGIGSYARRTLQPLAGRKNRGGQRCGEMETACLIAHDGVENLAEFLTTKSDCIDSKNRFIREMIETDLIRGEEKELCYVPESVKLLNAYLTLAGVVKDD